MSGVTNVWDQGLTDFRSVQATGQSLNAPCLINLEKNNERSEFYGKIAILAFTVIGTITFLILQIAWYRKFFEKLRRVNREIEVEIGENIKKKTLSTICK